MSSSAKLLWGDAEISVEWIGLELAWVRTNEYWAMRLFELAGIYDIYLMWRMVSKDGAFGTFSFLDLLGYVRDFEVSDPRDRDFALLNL